jgi:hypothetical protein
LREKRLKYLFEEVRRGIYVSPVSSFPLYQDTAKSVIEDDTFYTLSLLKRGVSHAFAPQSLTCCICNSSLHKIDYNPKIRLYSCGHVTHLTCESEEQHSQKHSKEHVCPICLPKKSRMPHEENGLIGFYSSNSKHTNGAVGAQRAHEADPLDRSRMSQIPRVTIIYLFIITIITTILLLVFEIEGTINLSITWFLFWELNQYLSIL